MRFYLDTKKTKGLIMAMRVLWASIVFTSKGLEKGVG